MFYKVSSSTKNLSVLRRRWYSKFKPLGQEWHRILWYHMLAIVDHQRCSQHSGRALFSRALRSSMIGIFLFIPGSTVRTCDSSCYPVLSLRSDNINIYFIPVQSLVIDVPSQFLFIGYWFFTGFWLSINWSMDYDRLFNIDRL